MQAVKMLGGLDTFERDEPGGQVRGGFESDLVDILIEELDKEDEHGHKDGMIDQNELKTYIKKIRPDGSERGGCACAIM